MGFKDALPGDIHMDHMRRNYGRHQRDNAYRHHCGCDAAYAGDQAKTFDQARVRYRPVYVDCIFDAADFGWLSNYGRGFGVFLADIMPLAGQRDHHNNGIRR